MTEEKVSRRSFLKILGAASGVAVVGIAGKSMFLKPQGNRTILHRVFGISFTEELENKNSWTYQGGKLSIKLAQIPELSSLGGAVQIDDNLLPEKVLVIHGADGNYYSFKNVCPHAGRKIDVLKGTMNLECCSISESTFDYEGKVLSGPAKESLTSYLLTVDANQLTITL